MNQEGAADVTAVVLTRDEARHLPDCLTSLAWAGRVLVLDSGSTDGTQDIARRAGARLESRPFDDFARQRQHALERVGTPWALFVDADERASPALAAAVAGAAGAGAACGYWIPRRNVFWGHVMRGGGWWPDFQLRLLRVDRARYDPGRPVHEVATVDGPVGQLDEPLEHLNYDSASEMAAKQRAYARLEARRRRAAGWRFRGRQLIGQPGREFHRRFVALGGWRDGGTGLVACAIMAGAEALTIWSLRGRAVS